MDRLRSECAWKASQTHESLLRFLLEESHEVLDAVETGTAEDLREELGDLLLQVVFHARVAQEGPGGRTPFDVTEVVRGITEKMRRRNPHVFDGTVDPTGLPPVDRDDPAAVNARWEAVKAAEKQRPHLMSGVPGSLPALLTALKAVERLERLELSGAPGHDESGAERGGASAADELGEQLWQLVERAHDQGLDPEAALRAVVRRRTTGH